MKELIHTLSRGNASIPTKDQFLSRDKIVTILDGGDLPHWNLSGVFQFITFRLADSLPAVVRKEYREIRIKWMSEHPKPWDCHTFQEYKKLIGDKIDNWLEKGYGECVLKNKEVRKIVEDQLRKYDGIAYELADFVIMPNHVHILICPVIDIGIIMKGLKGVTAREINKLLGRQGKLWQRNYFDIMIRNYNDYYSTSDYIKQNPEALYK